MGGMMVWRPPEAPEGRPACLSRGAARADRVTELCDRVTELTVIGSPG